MPHQIACLIDHTLLKADATQRDIESLCKEARTHGFASVCVLPSRVAFACQALSGSGVAVGTVIGFPLGGTSTTAKCEEARQAAIDGANEIDVVVNIGRVKDGDWAGVAGDLVAVRSAFPDGVMKVIFETCLLTDGEKTTLAHLCAEVGANFVKTSTGFSSGGATPEDVQLMAQAVKGRCQVKASGGIKTLEGVLKMQEAGATRIGTSSGVLIVSDASDQASDSALY